MSYQIRTVLKPISAHLVIRGSEEMTYRALLLGVLANGVSEISGLHLSENIKTFIEGFRHLGIVVQLDTKSSSCIIAGNNGKLPLKQGTLWCANTAIIAYFLTALCATTPGVYHLNGLGEAHDLCFNDFLTILHQQGVDVIPYQPPYTPFNLLGTESFEGGEIKFKSPTNGHFVSAMLMISPYARSPFILNTADLINEEEIELTCTMMAEFGVLVHRIHQGQFMIPVPQRYQARDYAIEADLSLAVYFFATAAITNGRISIPSIQRSSFKQLDIKFLSLLEKMGCEVIEINSELIVQGTNELHGIEISLRQFSNIFLALAAIAPFALSPTRITHIGNMYPQESVCLTALANKFKAMNIQIEIGSNWIKIFPSHPKGIEVNKHDDYRIAMTCAIMGLKVPGITIEDPECITQIYPDFFTLWSKLSQDQKIPVS